MLEVKNISYFYRTEHEVLKDVSFSLEQGEILSLLGPNGAGKTTLLRCILGLRRPAGGVIRVNGRDIYAIKPQERAGLLAYVPQSTSMAFPYEAREVVLMGRVAKLKPGAAPAQKDKAIAMQAMERLEIVHLAQKSFQEMSGGERQMVLVARALAQQSQLLIMDEPAANLDYSNQIRMLRVVWSLAQEGYAVLMTSHVPDHAFWIGGRAALMRGGCIWRDGAPDAVITGENLSELYRTPVSVVDVSAGDNAYAKASIPFINKGCPYIQ
ncbi:MAG: ABC transporter ATP-binding protein [Bacillota bacterium]